MYKDVLKNAKSTPAENRGKFGVTVWIYVSARRGIRSALRFRCPFLTPYMTGPVCCSVRRPPNTYPADYVCFCVCHW